MAPSSLHYAETRFNVWVQRQSLIATWRCCSQVRLRPDERYGVVRFGTAEAVQSAIDALHGTKICGEKIGVTRGDPLTGAHSNSKRPRMAPAQQDHMLSCAF